MILLRNWVDEHEKFGISSTLHEFMFSYVHLVRIKKGFGSMNKEKRMRGKTGEN